MARLPNADVFPNWKRYWPVRRPKVAIACLLTGVTANSSQPLPARSLRGRVC